MDVKDTAAEGSAKSDEHVIRNWRKRDSCYITAENLAELCPTIRREAELLNSGLSYLAEEIFKPSIKDVAWFLLAFNTKT